MRAMCVAVLLVLLTALGAVAEEAVFQWGLNGYESAEDVWLRTDYVIRNYGGHWGLRTQKKVSPRDPYDAIDTAFIVFNDIFGDELGQVPSGQQIDSATFTVWTGWGAENETGVDVHAMLKPILDYGTETASGHEPAVNGETCFAARAYWGEGDEQNEYWGSNDDPSSDGPVPGVDFSTDPALMVESGKAAWGTDKPIPPADITEIVKRWYSDALTNNGLCLRGQDGEYQNWWASQMSFNYPSYASKQEFAPMLVINYSPATGPGLGDADEDGDVEDDDLSLLLATWDQNAGWGGGNFNGDDIVDDDDLSLLLANWTGVLAGAVPEPLTIAVLAVGVLVLARRRK